MTINANSIINTHNGNIGMKFKYRNKSMPVCATHFYDSIY